MDSCKNEQRRWRDLCELHGPAADDAAAQNVPGKGVRQLSTWSFIPTSKVDLSLIEFLIWYFDQKALYLSLSSLSRSDRVRDICERGSLPIVHLRLGSAQRRSGVHSISCRGRGPPLEMLRMQQRVEKRRNWSDGRSHSGLVGWRICQIFSSLFLFDLVVSIDPDRVLNWIF